MSEISDILSSIKTLIHRYQSDTKPMPGKVVSVDLTKKTCVVSPINGDADVLDVRLQAAVTIKGSIVVPTVGSAVMVSMINKQTGFISMYSQVDSILLDGDKYGGLVKLLDPDDPTAGILKKVNNLENQINNILVVLKGTIIPLAPSGTYPFASLYASINALTTTAQADLENTKVKQGNGT